MFIINRRRLFSRGSCRFHYFLKYPLSVFSNDDFGGAFKLSWDISGSRDVSRVVRVLQIYRVVSSDTPCGGPTEMGKQWQSLFRLCLFISLFKGLEVRPTAATDSSCFGRNRHPGNTTSFQRCKVITTSIFKRNSYNVSPLRVRWTIWCWRRLCT